MCIVVQMQVVEELNLARYEKKLEVNLMQSYGELTSMDTDPPEGGARGTSCKLLAGLYPLCIFVPLETYNTICLSIYKSISSYYVYKKKLKCQIHIHIQYSDTWTEIYPTCFLFVLIIFTPLIEFICENVIDWAWLVKSFNNINFMCCYRQTALSARPDFGAGHQHTPHSPGLCEKDQVSWPWRYLNWWLNFSPL